MRSLSDFKGHEVENVFLEAQMGQINGAYVDWKFGLNANITTTESDIWEVGGSYVFPTNGATLSAVSSSTDTVDITIECLDANYLPIQETITLDGANPVSTINSFIRVNRAYNSNGISLVGNVTISHGANVVAYISVGSEQTLQSIYTVPAGYTAYLFQGMASTGKGKDAQVYFKYRLFGKVFRVSETFGLYQNTYEAYRPFIPIPEKADIRVTAISSSASTNVSCQFGLLLMQNLIWSN